MRLKSYKRNIKTSLGIKDFKSSRTNSIGSKGETKNFKKRRHLSRLYSNNNSLKIVHV